jgi:hypothetical protein
VSISTKWKVKLLFSRKFQNNVQNIENYDTYDADIKVTGTAVNKSPKISGFPAYLKLGVRPVPDRNTDWHQNRKPDPDRHRNYADPLQWSCCNNLRCVGDS